MMDAAAKSQMLVLAGIDEERMRFLEHCGIAIACVDGSDNAVSAAHGAAKDLLILNDIASSNYDRWCEPQNLFHRAARQEWVGAQFRQLLRMVQQQDEAVADQIGRCQVAGKQQEKR